MVPEAFLTSEHARRPDPGYGCGQVLARRARGTAWYTPRLRHL